MVLMLLAIAALLLSESLPLLTSRGPVDANCPVQPRKLTCELGASLVKSLPPESQRTFLGAVGLIATAGVAWLTWIFAKPRPKSK